MSYIKKINNDGINQKEELINIEYKHINLILDLFHLSKINNICLVWDSINVPKCISTYMNNGGDEDFYLISSDGNKIPYNLESSSMLMFVFIFYDDSNKVIGSGLAGSHS